MSYREDAPVSAVQLRLEPGDVLWSDEGGRRTQLRLFPTLYQLITPKLRCSSDKLSLLRRSMPRLFKNLIGNVPATRVKEA